MWKATPKDVGIGIATTFAWNAPCWRQSRSHHQLITKTVPVIRPVTRTGAEDGRIVSS
jgi:hypothetical protein